MVILSEWHIKRSPVHDEPWLSLRSQGVSSKRSDGESSAMLPTYPLDMAVYGIGHKLNGSQGRPAISVSGILQLMVWAK